MGANPIPIVAPCHRVTRGVESPQVFVGGHRAPALARRARAPPRQGRRYPHEGRAEPERRRAAGRLSNAIVRIMREFYGKGAARSRTMIFDDYVFVVLEDVLTTAEMTLRNGAPGDLVRRVRMRFEDLMTATFVGEVERLTGRTVVAYHSQVVLEPPSCFEIFVLDPTQEGVGTPRRRRAGRGGRPSGARAGRRRRPAALAGREGRRRRARRCRLLAGRGRGLRAAISNAVVRLITELYGKGAARTRTFIADDHVFCALEGVLTTVERTLVEAVRPSSCASCATASARWSARCSPRGRAPARAQVLAMEPQLVFDGHAVPHLRPRGRARQRAGRPAGEIKKRVTSEGTAGSGRYHRPPVNGDALARGRGDRGATRSRGSCLRAVPRLIEKEPWRVRTRARCSGRGAYASFQP